MIVLNTPPNIILSFIINNNFVNNEISEAIKGYNCITKTTRRVVKLRRVRKSDQYTPIFILSWYQLHLQNIFRDRTGQAHNIQFYTQIWSCFLFIPVHCYSFFILAGQMKTGCKGIVRRFIQRHLMEAS